MILEVFFSMFPLGRTEVEPPPLAFQGWTLPRCSEPPKKLFDRDTKSRQQLCG